MFTPKYQNKKVFKNLELPSAEDKKCCIYRPSKNINHVGLSLHRHRIRTPPVHQYLKIFSGAAGCFVKSEYSHAFLILVGRLK
jgi:hypothetical protein